MGIVIEAACYCHIGRVRGNNEDNFLFCGKTLEQDNRGLKKPTVASVSEDCLPVCFAVFDGMGGEAFGENASFTAARVMCEQAKRLSSYVIPEREFLLKSCDEMNRAVCEAAQELGTEHMGSTVAALLFGADEVYACNLGDSKAFRLRGGVFMQLTEDHTDEAYLRQNGIEGRKPRLTQHLGINPEEIRIEPYVAKGELQKGDRYLICSDGLTDMLSRMEICNTMIISETVAKCADRLVRKALSAGGKDNISVILIEVR